MEEALKLILNKLNSMDSNIKDLRSEVKTIGNQVTKIENQHNSKLDSLLDSYKQLYEGQLEIKDDIRNLQQNQENQDIEIKVINNKTKAI